MRLDFDTFFASFLLILLTVLLVGAAFLVNDEIKENRKLDRGEINEQQYCEKYKMVLQRQIPALCLKYYLPNN